MGEKWKPIPGYEGKYAIAYLETALKWMNKRVEDRLARSVLGTMQR